MVAACFQELLYFTAMPSNMLSCPGGHAQLGRSVLQFLDAHQSAGQQQKEHCTEHPSLAHFIAAAYLPQYIWPTSQFHKVVSLQGCLTRLPVRLRCAMS